MVVAAAVAATTTVASRRILPTPMNFISFSCRIHFGIVMSSPLLSCLVSSTTMTTTQPSFHPDRRAHTRLPVNFIPFDHELQFVVRSYDFFALFVLLLLSCCVFCRSIFSFIASISCICGLMGCASCEPSDDERVRIQWIINYVFKPFVSLLLSHFVSSSFLILVFAHAKGYAPCSPPLNARFALRRTPHALNTHANTTPMTTIANIGCRRKTTLK